MLFEAYDNADTMAAERPLPTDDEALSMRYQHIRLSGQYDPGRQILLDSMTHDGDTGYHVLTPLRAAGGTVLVNRGWVPAGKDRAQLPSVGVSGVDRELSGRIDRLPRPGLRLDGGRGTGWPRRMLYPALTEIEAALGYPVRGYQLLLGPDEADGFIRDWRPAIMSENRHLGYAFQWFSIAAACIAIYVAVNLHASREKSGA